jgi:hypothetical protein
MQKTKIMNPEAADYHLLRNFPHGEEFCEKSFLSILHESETWDEDGFWLLDKAIYDLAAQYQGSDIPRSVAWPLVRVYSYLFVLMHAHVNPKDCFRIKNMDDMTLSEWRERAELTLEGFFKGEMVANHDFERINPLL